VPTSDESKIEHIMKHTVLHAYLATCYGDEPLVRPVSPIVESITEIYVATSVKSRKVDQIRKNPRVALAFVELPHGDQAATVMGHAVIVQALDEKQRLWDKAGFDLSARFPGGPEDEDLCFLKVVPERIEWRDRWEGGLKVYRPPAM
jgi:general stress protein 26